MVEHESELPHHLFAFTASNYASAGPVRKDVWAAADASAQHPRQGRSSVIVARIKNQ
jgi:hypothetical protein